MLSNIILAIVIFGVGFITGFFVFNNNQEKASKVADKVEKTAEKASQKAAKQVKKTTAQVKKTAKAVKEKIS